MEKMYKKVLFLVQWQKKKIVYNTCFENMHYSRHPR